MKNEFKYVSKWTGKILHIYDFTYRQNFYFIPAKTHKEYQEICWKQLKLKIEPKDSETGGGFNVFRHHHTDVCYLWSIPNYKRNIVHECFHAVSYTLRQRGLQLNDDTEEAFAYAIGFLADEIFANLRRK